MVRRPISFSTAIKFAVSLSAVLLAAVAANAYLSPLSAGGASSVSATNGTAAAPSISFQNQTDSGLYRVGSEDIGFSIDATKVIDIQPSGVTITPQATTSMNLTLQAIGSQSGVLLQVLDSSSARQGFINPDGSLHWNEAIFGNDLRLIGADYPNTIYNTNNPINISSTAGAGIDILATNQVAVDTSGDTLTGQFEVHDQSTTRPNVIIKAIVSQTADQLDVNDSTGVTHFSLDVNGNPILANTVSAPTCSSSIRGMLYFVQSGSGTGDILEMCAKGTANTYSWVTVKQAP